MTNPGAAANETVIDVTGKCNPDTGESLREVSFVPGIETELCVEESNVSAFMEIFPWNADYSIIKHAQLFLYTIEDKASWAIEKVFGSSWF